MKILATILIAVGLLLAGSEYAVFKIQILINILGLTSFIAGTWVFKQN